MVSFITVITPGRNNLFSLCFEGGTVHQGEEEMVGFMMVTVGNWLLTLSQTRKQPELEMEPGCNAKPVS